MYLPWKELIGVKECQDSDDGGTDAKGYTCELYDHYFEYCGWYDTESFIANEMCCCCKI